MIKEKIVFLREFVKEFKTTGAVMPTSKWAAKAMVLPLRKRPTETGLKILELGPGTGSVTVSILENMGFEDELTVCEINPRFMQSLKSRLSDNYYYSAHKSRISFHCCPMQDLPEDKQYDVIICAIPFLNFELPLVEDIFGKIKRLSTEETVMTYYEYVGLRRAGMVFSPPKRRKRLKSIERFFKPIFEKHLNNREVVWLNMLPIQVYQLNQLGNLKEAV